MNGHTNKKRKLTELYSSASPLQQPRDTQRFITSAKFDFSTLAKGSREEEKCADHELLTSKVQSLKSILNFDISFISDQQHLLNQKFLQIADSLLNQQLLVVNQTNLFRIAEIEFYLNDQLNHQDLFCHDDVCNEQPLKWYFLKQNGKSYKAGTYKGLNLTFGKQEKQTGAILIRSMVALNKENCGTFIEGPCNCLNEIFRVTSSQVKEKIKEVKDFVILPDFSFDPFDETSLMYFRPQHTHDQKQLYSIYLEERKVWDCARVGLTLKKFSQEKSKFWMADYRFLAFPEKQKKMNLFVVLSMLRKGYAPKSIEKMTTMTLPSILIVSQIWNQAQKQNKIKKFEDFKKHSSNMTQELWTNAYAFHWQNEQ